MKMTKALLAYEIDGALVDNYVLTHSLNLIQDEPIRIERYIDHQITYGVVLTKNSSKTEKCFRNFLHNHPQEVFEIIAANLVPLKVRFIPKIFSKLSIVNPLTELTFAFSLYRRGKEKK